MEYFEIRVKHHRDLERVMKCLHGVFSQFNPNPYGVSFPEFEEGVFGKRIYVFGTGNLEDINLNPGIVGFMNKGVFVGDVFSVPDHAKWVLFKRDRKPERRSPEFLQKSMKLKRDYVKSKFELSKEYLGSQKKHILESLQEYNHPSKEESYLSLSSSKGNSRFSMKVSMVDSEVSQPSSQSFNSYGLSMRGSVAPLF